MVYVVSIFVCHCTAPGCPSSTHNCTPRVLDTFVDEWENTSFSICCFTFLLWWCTWTFILNTDGFHISWRQHWPHIFPLLVTRSKVTVWVNGGHGFSPIDTKCNLAVVHHRGTVIWQSKVGSLCYLKLIVGSWCNIVPIYFDVLISVWPLLHVTESKSMK